MNLESKESIWVILDKNDNFCSFGSKCAWVTSGAAKAAFSFHVKEYNEGLSSPFPAKIENYPEYKLIEIKA